MTKKQICICAGVVSAALIGVAFVVWYRRKKKVTDHEKGSCETGSTESIVESDKPAPADDGEPDWGPEEFDSIDSISFSQDEDHEVVVEIKDALGELVRSLSEKDYRQYRKDREAYEEFCEKYTPLPDDDREEGHRIISEREFYEQKDLFDKLNLEYWEVDDVLLDDQHNVVSDVKYVTGLSNLARWFGSHPGEHILFVRNYNISTDYEIALVKGSFLGIDELNV